MQGKKEIFNAELVSTIEHDDIVNNLHNIQDFLRWGFSVFEQADLYYGQGTDGAYNDILHLVLATLRLPLKTPESWFSSRLTAIEKQQLVDLIIQRLVHRIPVAYLTNQSWFCDLPFYIDERVIVPRSPMSALIQDQFAGLIDNPPQRILDLCTGSGCIAIACAEQFPEVEVDAVDLSVEALNVCEINVADFNLNHRVFPIKSDLFKELLPAQYDLIITNPPYVDMEDLADMPAEYHAEPDMALGSGDDGLDITKRILAQAGEYLTLNGVLICEVGNSMLALMEQFPQVPFNWLELKNGGIGVFSLTRDDLMKYKYVFDANIADQD